MTSYVLPVERREAINDDLTLRNVETYILFMLHLRMTMSRTNNDNQGNETYKLGVTQGICVINSF